MYADPRLAAAFPSCRDYQLAVSRLPLHDTRPLSLFLHIPDFFSDPHPDAALATYLSYLRRETTMLARLFAGASSVRQLCFDGGGAASLPERALDALLRHLRRHFRFMDGEAGDYEAAVDAALVPPGRLWRLRERGFQRLRIDFDGDAAGRLPALVDDARATGFRSVCVALAYGMPGLRLERLRTLLETVIGAAPDRVALCRRAGMPDGCAAPGSVAQRMEQLCADRLDMASYTHTGAGRYARLPGDTGPAPAWDRGPDFGSAVARCPASHLVGCGVQARSAVGPVSCRNVSAVDDYYALLDRNELPVAQLLSQEQTEPYLMQVKDFQDADQ
jgi:oxygen-independent coproporphyrinogen-3 oxidase